jgi:membrane protease YdiL (CAAX protease family)
MKSLGTIPLLKLVALAAISGVVTYLFSRLFVETRPHLWVSALGMTTFYATFTLGLLWLIQNRTRPTQMIRSPNFSRKFVLEILWASFILVTFSFGVFYLVHYPLSYLTPAYVEWIFQESNPFLVMDSAESIVLNIALALTIIFLVPVVEELVFRGILFRKWKAKLGHWPSLGLVSLIFAVLHFDMIGGFVFSMAMITLMAKFGTVAAPLMCHMVYNAIVIWGMAITTLIFPDFSWSITSLRSSVWVGVAAIAISLPTILLFFKRNRNFLKGYT